jgi:hypothetical protein
MTGGACDGTQGVSEEVAIVHLERTAMSFPEGSASPQGRGTESKPRGDRLRVITAGRVGDMEAQLGASGFDVAAVAETEDALIDAVSGDEPDAIVVEADLCDSLEHVRDLAPDAVLIVIGDHTPAGALGRVERGMSGTAMAGLLHALVAEGVGAAVVWGLVPTFGAGAALHVPHGVGVSLLFAKADLIRAHLANALRDPAELVTAVGTVALTVSASVLVTLSAPRTHERPERVPVPAPTVERAPQHPVVALSPPVRTPVHGPSRNEGEPGDRRGPNLGEFTDHGRHDDQGGNQDNNDQGGNQDNNDQGGNQDNNDQGENQDNNDQGENQDTNDQGGNQDNADQGGNQDNADQGGNQDNADQGKDEGNDQGKDQHNDDQARTRAVGDRGRLDPPAAFGIAPRTSGRSRYLAGAHQ